MTSLAADELLSRGELAIEARLVEASNTTLRCWLTHHGQRVRCVYKPVAGERPLSDFPDGTLGFREVAAWLVAQACGEGLVPPTVYREGPLGPGACQLWIEDEGAPVAGFVPATEVPDGWHGIAAAADPEGRRYLLAHADDPQLARLALFDAVINNADRKAGHLIVAADGTLYGVDHGVSFHTAPKLRSVLWGWAGEPLPTEGVRMLDELATAVAGSLGSVLTGYLTEEEITALAARIDRLLAVGRFPEPDPTRPVIPWPPV